MNEKNTQIKVSGIEFEFDIYDVEQSENFEKAIEQLSESEEEIKKGVANQKMSEVNKAFIKMFRQFFITATGVDVLADCKNTTVAEQAYLDFLDAVGKMKGNLFQKYDTARVR